MDLIVLAKYVPDVLKVPEEAWDHERGTLRRQRLKLVFNPLDRVALRTALRISQCQSASRNPGRKMGSGTLAKGSPTPFSGLVEPGRNPQSAITVMTMGPPVAARLLREAVAHAAEFGAEVQPVLLTDRAFAGADTLATAYTLTTAIRHLVAIGRVSREFMVVCGMQSPDGDTAQVPAQVASLLDAPMYPYVVEVQRDSPSPLQIEERGEGPGRSPSPLPERERDSEKCAISRYRCLNPVGFQVVTPRSLPHVITVTRLAEDLPFYVSLEGILRAQSAEILTLDARAIGVERSRIGLAGSRTRVVRIFPAERRTRKAPPLVAEREDFPIRLRDLWRRVREAFAGVGRAPGVFAEPTALAQPCPREAYYTGDCVAVCELDEGGLTPASFEVTSRAAQLARSLGVRCAAVVCGQREMSAETAAEALRQVGASALYVLEGARDEAFRVREQALALAAFLAERKPQVVVFPATLTGRVVAPYVAAQLDSGLTADCSALDIGDYTAFDRAAGRTVTYHRVLEQTRPALGGNIMARIVSIYRDRSVRRPQMATARPGALPRVEQPAEKCPVIPIPPRQTPPMAVGGKEEGCPSRIADCGLRIAAREHIVLERRAEAKGEVDLRDFEAVVCVGMGIKDRETIDRLVRPFAAALGRFLGCEVGLGASRAVVDAGLLPHARQIGQTGIVVKPKLYVGLGVSGAVQHRIGMEGARIVVSVNRDAEAPLHALADYAVTGDLAEVLPALAVALG